MDKEHIEKAAVQYAQTFIESSITAYRSFKVGADWRINSVWHDVSYEPDLKKLLLVECIDGTYNLTYMTKIKKWKGFVQYEHYARWAYVDDLLPTKGGENE